MTASGDHPADLETTATTMAKRQSKSGATTGYEAELWAMADALRGSMDAAEYKHVVLGLIFLKYISDAFEERHAAVLAEWGEDAAEDRDEDIAEIAATYHAWRGGEGVVEYEDEAGFCKSATLEEVGGNGHVLTPGRYVGMKPQEDDGEPFQERMARLAAEWRRQRAEASRLDAAIEDNLRSLGFGVEVAKDRGDAP